MPPGRTSGWPSIPETLPAAPCGVLHFRPPSADVENRTDPEAGISHSAYQFP